MPLALGGTNEPSNLTTACQECNAGKGSTNPDAPTVEAVDARHLQWRAAVALAGHEAQQESPEVVKAIAGVVESWDGICVVTTQERETIKQYVLDGLPADTMIACADIARGSFHVKIDSMFPYMIGIARNKLAAIHKRAREIVAEQDGI